MLSINDSHCKFAQIENKEALKFCIRDSQGNVLDLTQTASSVGCYYKKELIAVTIFDAPKESEKKKKYSKELVAMQKRGDLRLSGVFLELINFYVDNEKPYDFFVSNETIDFLNVQVAFRSEYEPLLNKFSKVDGIFEWVNLDYTFYTYKIIADDSDKYYFGYSHVKKRNASISDCNNDGYMGSGGLKFQNWLRNHPGAYKKILKTFSRRAEALDHEKNLVGDKFKSDENCLNSHPGGYVSNGGWNHSKISMEFCNEHGDSKWKNGVCIKCFAFSTIKMKDCPIHGSTKFQGPTCLRCKISKSFEMGECVDHGFVLHRKGKCVTCRNQKQVTENVCNEHGRTKHIGETCYKCIFNEIIHESECSIHGTSRFYGSQCFRCIQSQKYSKKSCEVHGISTFTGESCAKCTASRKFSKEICGVHGLTTFNAENCVKCLNSDSWEMQECSSHGLAKHFGGACWPCKNSRSVRFKECSKHGVSKHIGKNCYKCSNSRSVSLKSCGVHGITKFQGNTCCRCSAEKRKPRRTKA